MAADYKPMPKTENLPDKCDIIKLNVIPLLKRATEWKNLSNLNQVNNKNKISYSHSVL